MHLVHILYQFFVMCLSITILSLIANADKERKYFDDMLKELRIQANFEACSCAAFLCMLMRVQSNK